MWSKMPRSPVSFPALETPSEAIVSSADDISKTFSGISNPRSRASFSSAARNSSLEAKD
tara:strand:- start:2008 stop:2184 length:177 start_codon:yes stop_codon:yes gene_type:complete